jgi:hypothetical protein
MSLNRPALWKLLRHVGVDVLRVMYASDGGAISLGSPDPVLAVDRLVRACSDRALDCDVRTQACRVLGAGPLDLVLPWLVPPLKRADPWAAEVLYIAASAQYGTPVQALTRIRFGRPDLDDTVDAVLRAITAKELYDGENED